MSAVRRTAVALVKVRSAVTLCRAAAPFGVCAVAFTVAAHAVAFVAAVGVFAARFGAHFAVFVSFVGVAVVRNDGSGARFAVFRRKVRSREGAFGCGSENGVVCCFGLAHNIGAFVEIEIVHTRIFDFAVAFIPCARGFCLGERRRERGGRAP